MTHFELRSEPRCDYVTVIAPGPPESYRFERDATGRTFRRGAWVGAEHRSPQTGEVATRASLAGWEAGLGCPLAGWPAGSRMTRVDIRRDVEGLPVTVDLRRYLAGGRADCWAFRESARGRTVYYGSPASHLLLRLYEKSGEADLPPMLLAEWTSHGWCGGDVTRVEFQLRTRVLSRTWPQGGGEADWPAFIAAAWSDALARMRLTARPVARYSQAADAPTDPRWLSLGKPCRVKLPGRRVSDADPEMLRGAIERYLMRGLTMTQVTAVVGSLARAWRAGPP